MADGKTISATRLRGMLAKHLAVLEAMGDAEVPLDAFNREMAAYQRTITAAQQAGVALGGASAQRPAQAAQTPGMGNPGADAGVPSGRQDLSAEMAERARQAAEAHGRQQQAEDQALADAVMAARLERIQKAALERYPAIAPLLDMVSGEDEAGYMEAARQLSEALGGQEAGPPPPPAPPVLAGNPPLEVETAADGRRAAMQTARKTGRWSDYFRIIDAQARGE